MFLLLVEAVRRLLPDFAGDGDLLLPLDHPFCMLRLGPCHSEVVLLLLGLQGVVLGLRK